MHRNYKVERHLLAFLNYKADVLSLLSKLSVYYASRRNHCSL